MINPPATNLTGNTRAPFTVEILMRRIARVLLILLVFTFLMIPSYHGIFHPTYPPSPISHYTPHSYHAHPFVCFICINAQNHPFALTHAAFTIAFALAFFLFRFNIRKGYALTLHPRGRSPPRL